MWMGSGSNWRDEWIELKNTTSSPADIGGWKLEKLDSSIIFEFPTETKIYDYLIISEYNEANSILAMEPNLTVGDPEKDSTSFSLSNDNLEIKLIDSEENIVDIAGDGGKPLAGENKSGNPKKSMERKDGCLYGTKKECWQTCFKAANLDAGASDLATPGAENSEEIIISPPPPPSHNIRINELLPDPEGDDKKGEFIELYNFSGEKINLENWKLKDKGGTEYVFPQIEIGNKEFLALYYKDSKISLNNSGEEIIYLYDPDGDEVNKVSYTDAETDKSYAFDGKDYKWSKYPTPAEENIFKKDYPGGVYLNEILPDPEGDEEKEEFIELYNGSDKNINLEGWIIKDDTKTSRYIFSKGVDIGSEEYLVIYRKDFDFALNNSGDEKVYLLNPNDETVSSVSYSDSNESVSYNFDGKNWRWSKDITPGKKNKFNKLPKIEVDIDDKVYIGVYADFEVKVNDPEKEKVKVTWDFGDGHKSYKKETRHKYEKKEKYKLKVKIFDGSEEVVKEYKIEAKKFPHREVKIRALCPNPAGDDSENEWILVKNYSDDEVNLKGWSVATGSKKLYNHPIYEDIKIKKGKTGKIAREDSNFTLNNKKSKVELRYPDGEEAYEVKYDKGDDNTAEKDEVYEKTDDGWRWVKTQTNPVKFAEADHGAGADETQTNVDTTQAGAEEAEEEDFSEFLGGWSEDESDKISRDELLNYGTQIKLAVAVYSSEGKVLGASTENHNEPIYHFTKSSPGEHYAAKFFKKILLNINYFINKVFLMFP